MSRLTRDGTAEPVSRDQILRQERGQGNTHFSCSADHVQDWQPYPVDRYSCYMCDHTVTLPIKHVSVEEPPISTVRNLLPDKRGTGPMPVGGILDGVAESGKNPVSKHQVQPESDQTDAGRDGRTPLARPNSQARTRTGKKCFPCPADHEQDWQPYPVNPYSAEYFGITVILRLVNLCLNPSFLIK